MKPIHLTVAAGGVASVLAASIGAYALGHHNGSQGGDTGPKVAVHATPTPSPQASPTGSEEPTQKGTAGAQATVASTTTSRTQSTHTVTVVTTPNPTAVPTQTQTSSSSQTSSSTSSRTSTTSSTSTSSTPTCPDRTLANNGGSYVGTPWTVDQACGHITLSFQWIAYPGWSSFSVTTYPGHAGTVWQGTVDSNTTAIQSFNINLSPGSFVLNNTGNGSYNGSGTTPEWSVTITEAP